MTIGVQNIFFISYAYKFGIMNMNVNITLSACAEYLSIDERIYLKTDNPYDSISLPIQNWFTRLNIFIT